MISDRTLKPTIIAAVSGLHALLLLGVWQATPPQLDISTDSLSYVDLSGLSQAGATATTAENPAPTPTPPQPKPKPRPVEKPKPVMKPVVKPAVRGDVAAPKEEPKPVEKKEPAPQPATSGGQTAQTENQGGGAAGQGSGRGSGQSGDGGNAGGSLVPPTHIGGHLGNPKPPYPALSRENGEQGSVGLRVQVSADGRAQSVAVVKSSGYPRLDRSAKNAVERYRFRPATRGGVPIAYNYTFSINFSLKDR